VATDGLVRSLGYRTTTFASAEDYLQSDRINDTSCVITDVQMPGLSGVELQSVLLARSDPTPMIFITAFPVKAGCPSTKVNGGQPPDHNLNNLC
jgi:FixJ family two-component response regulator